MDGDVVDSIYMCVQTWLLNLVVCFLATEVGVCVCVFFISHLKGKMMFWVTSSKG